MLDLDFTFLEMNPFTLVDGKPYPLDMRGELDDTAAFKNFKKCVSSPYIAGDLIWILLHFFFVTRIRSCNVTLHVSICRWGNIEFPLPFGRVMSSTETFIHGLDEKVL